MKVTKVPFYSTNRKLLWLPPEVDFTHPVASNATREYFLSAEVNRKRFGGLRSDIDTKRVAGKVSCFLKVIPGLLEFFPRCEGQKISHEKALLVSQSKKSGLVRRFEWSLATLYFFFSWSH